MKAVIRVSFLTKRNASEAIKIKMNNYENYLTRFREKME